MNQNNLIYSTPIKQLVNNYQRHPNERTIHAKWTTVPTLGEMANDESAIMNHFDLGMPTVATIPHPSDVSHKLVAVTPHIEQINNRPCALVYLRYYPIGTRSKGGAGFTAQQINQFIENSLDTSNNAYNMPRIRNSAIPSHFPNWFRPKFVVNSNLDYFSLDASSGENPTGTPSNIFKPEFAVGLSLPYDEVAKEHALVIYENVQDVEVWGACYQAINTTHMVTDKVMPLVGGVDPALHTYVFQRIMIECEAKFIVID